MEYSLIKISIYYSSSKWFKLIKYIDELQASYNVENAFIFFNTQKGDCIRLVLVTNSTQAAHLTISITDDINKYLLSNPTKRSSSSLSAGETLWINYPNNSLSINNFKSEPYWLPGQGNDHYFSAFFSTIFSAYLFKHPVSKKTMSGDFLQLVILIAKGFDTENIHSNLNDVIEAIEEKSELRQQPAILNDIYQYAMDDLSVNWELVNALVNLTPSTKNCDMATLSFLSEIEKRFKETKATSTHFTMMINLTILHLGIDFKKQLYALLIFKNYLQA